MTENNVETSTKLPWKVGSRSYNIAVELIARPLPRNTVQRKTQLLALEVKNGASHRTLEDVMAFLRKHNWLPEYTDAPWDDSVKRVNVHGTVSGTVEKSEKMDKTVHETVETVHDTVDASPKNVADTVEKGGVLRKNVAQANFNAEAAQASAREREEILQETAPDPQKLREIVESSEKTQRTVQETAPQGNILVFPPEVLEALKKVATLDEKVSNLPETIKQGVTDYVRSIGGPAPSQEDVETQANLKIEEGSAVARMVYLTPKTLLYYDFSRGRGFKGNLSEFLNNFIDSWFKRQDIKVGVIEKQEWGD